jgi:soluble lytic murein transglycosylase
MKKHLYPYILIFGLLLPWLAFSTQLRAPQEISCPNNFEQALKTLSRGREPVLPSLHCPLERKLIFWLWFQDCGYTFFEGVSFLKANPHWPSLRKIRTQIELSIHKGIPKKDVIAYFEEYPPLTSEGALTYAQALWASEGPSRSLERIKKIWWTSNFTSADEKTFYKLFKNYFAPIDNQKRLSRLIMEGNFYGLERMKSYVSKASKTAIDYVLGLFSNKKRFKVKWKDLSPSYQTHPGIMVQRLKWLLIRKEKEESENLFMDLFSKDLLEAYPEQLVQYRTYFARSAFKKGDPNLAYALLTKNRISPNKAMDLVNFVEGEFLAGWLALRHLNRPNEAKEIFGELYTYVKTPISRSKMAYWLGETETALGHTEQAEEWYKKSAQWPHVFYGQLSLKRLNKDLDVSLMSAPEKVTPTPQEAELIEALRHLAPFGFEGQKETLLIHLARTSSPDLAPTLVELTHEIRMPQLAVFIAKIVGKNASVLTHKAYPTLRFSEDILDLPHLSAALLHSVIRQESNFNCQSVSNKGAQGFMQLMFATAKELAKKLRLPLHKKHSIQKPEVNLILGSHNLSQILKEFDGNIVLALASYNAGKSRALEWIKTFGDPRHKAIDVIDWIESIPFGETRGYIQRILESIPIYEVRLKNK